MLFSDPIFLFVFLPLVLLLFYIAPKKLKNIVLLIFSLAFYAWGEQKMVVLLILSSVVDYFSALLIDKKFKKSGLFISLFFNIGILVYYKYSNFLFENLYNITSLLDKDSQQIVLNVTMPLGISFFTFQTMSYTIDVYRGKVKACRNFINFLTYVSLFPQLVAGPIVRYEQIEQELKFKNLSIDQFSEGISRFIKGLFKKIFIANNLALIADVAFENPEGYGTLFSWIGIVFYTLNIFYDVSGYTDMAIGLGKMFGFNFPENFNYPYMATSIKDFWRRWHITMSTWFKDYIYISLGGNRKREKRTIINLIIVFAITGIWHGAAWNFVFWGLWHGFFLILERKNWLSKISKVWRNIYVLIIVMLGWIIFKADNIGHALVFTKQLFVYQPIVDLNMIPFYLRAETILAFVLAGVFIFPVKDRISIHLMSNTFLKNHFWSLKIITHTLMLLICFTYISIGAYNPFIYFRF